MRNNAEYVVLGGGKILIRPAKSQTTDVESTVEVDIFTKLGLPVFVIQFAFFDEGKEKALQSLRFCYGQSATFEVACAQLCQIAYLSKLEVEFCTNRLDLEWKCAKEDFKYLIPLYSYGFGFKVVAIIKLVNIFKWNDRRIRLLNIHKEFRRIYGTRFPFSDSQKIDFIDRYFKKIICVKTHRIFHSHR